MVWPSSTWPLVAVSVSSSGGAQGDCVLYISLESGGFDLELVVAGVQVGDVPGAFRRGDAGEDESGALVGDGHLGSGYDRPRGVGDGADHGRGARGRLGEQACRTQGVSQKQGEAHRDLSS